MNIKFISITMLTISLAVWACYEKLTTGPSAHERTWLSIPALPIIQDAIIQISPKFKDLNAAPVMSQLCALARGEIKQEQVNVFLKEQGIDSQIVLEQGAPLSLLINDDQPGQATACAAYLASSVLSSVNITEFMVPVVVPTTNGQPEKKSLTIDNNLLATTLSTKLALARANTDIFALIAKELQRRPGLTIAQYREQASQLFSRLAPTYLQQVKEQVPPATTQYKLLQMDDSKFVFKSSVGAVFEFGSSGLVLRQSGTTWYGKGLLMGQKYSLKVNYYPKTVEALLNSSTLKQPNPLSH